MKMWRSRPAAERDQVPWQRVAAPDVLQPGP